MADVYNSPIPPANFLFLVESILVQAQLQLGLINFGETEEQDAKPDLVMARHSIDLLGMLQEKTAGNLTIEEQRLLENGLTELRFRFVQVADEMELASEPETSASSLLSEGAPKVTSGPMIITPDGGKGSKTN